MMRAIVLFAVCAIAVLLVRPRDARAETERLVRFSLRLEDQNGRLTRCGGRVGLEQAVEARLHRPVFGDENAADIRIAVTLGRSREAHIREQDRAGVELGRRDVTIAGDACDKALDTLAVVLAILVGPPRTVVELEPIPEAPRPQAIAPPPPGREPPHAIVVPPARWSAAPVAELVGGAGILPGVSWGVQGGMIVGTPIRPLFLIARAEYWFPRGTGTNPPANVDRLGGALLGCLAVLRTPKLELAVCGGANAGRLRTSSMALTRSSDTALLLDVLGESRFGYRFRLRKDLTIEPILAIQAAVLLRRDRFTYRDLSARELTLLQPAPLAVQGSLGVALHFL